MRTPRTPRRDRPRHLRRTTRRRLALVLSAAAALLLVAMVSGYRDTQAVAVGGGSVARRALRPPRGGGGGAVEAVFRPGEPLLDSTGARLQAHGGWLLRAGGKWWWYGEDKEGPTYHNGNPDLARVDVIGISAYWSTDLAVWHRAGLALPAGVHPDLAPSTSVLERPAVLHHAPSNTYVMWAHVDTADYQAARLGVAVASRPEGPFSYIRSFRPHGDDARDVTLFQDDDGAAYVVYSANGNKDLVVAALTPDYRDVAPHGRVVALPGRGREAPALFKAHGRYFLLTSGCTGWEPNAAEAFVADHPLAREWTSLGPPATGGPPAARARTFFSQPAFVVPAPHGPPGAFIYGGDAWSRDDLAASRYVWLPLWVLPPAPRARGGDGLPSVVLQWAPEWRLSDLNVPPPRPVRRSGRLVDTQA